MPSFTFSLSCTARDGTSASFDVQCRAEHASEGEAASWTFIARAGGARPEDDFFLLTLEQLDEVHGRIVAMAHHYCPAVMAKGIPDALIPAAARLSGLAVQSSPRAGETRDVYRSADAEKVWRRLEKRGEAVYDPQADVFTYVPPASNKAA